MKKPVAPIYFPGRMTMLAALCASLALPALAAPGNVVVSQLYGAGGNAGASRNRDYIELFNRSASPVSLAGMSVQYQSASGTAWQSTALPNVSLAAGQYFLVTGAGGANGSDVGTADQTGSLNLSATTGKVALSKIAESMTPANQAANIVDLVGFGTANSFEGKVAPAPSTTMAIFRAANGCTDTDNNADDFSAGIPAARNTSASANVCGATTPAVKPIVFKTSCPASVSFAAGSGGAITLVATDLDSNITSASISAGARAGVSLGSFVASGAGAEASATLSADASVPVGAFVIDVTFANDTNASESATCKVTLMASGTSTIPQIQGSGAKSPVADMVQTTEGVITFKTSSGFYIQHLAGDGDPTTSDGIFVFGGVTPAVVGELVRVTGTVTEFTPGSAPASITQFKDTTSIVRLGGGYTVTPTNVSMPADLERYEGMLVRFTGSLIVNAVDSLGERGELTLASVRREVPTSRYRPGSAEALDLAARNAADQIVLDDLIFTQSATIPYIAADKTVRAGDSVDNLIGIVDYGSIGNSKYGYKLQPLSVGSVSIVRSNPRTAGPELPSGNVKVASANVLNFFTTFTNGASTENTSTGNGCTIGTQPALPANCRGADNMEEFLRQRGKIVHELKAIDADVVGLMEIQNNGNIAVDHLVGALNAAMGPNTYAAVPVPSFTGTDAIRVAMIYKPARVAASGLPIADDDRDINNRATLAQTFKAGNGAKFSVVVNHLKSKRCGSASGANADKFDGQGCWNADRLDQANRLKDYFIPRVIRESGDPDVLVIGDMNAHGFEDPIRALTDAGMVNQLERFVRPREMVYSYVFDGLAGYLDHALATASLDAQMAGATEWHNNADEPEVIDYNFNLGTTKTAKPQDLYENNAYRASDHDPVVVSLNLAATFFNVTSSFTVQRSGFTQNRATGQYTGTYRFTNNSGAAINGPFQLELAGLPAGVTLVNATGAHNGLPYISAGGASIAPGATVTVTTTFANPNKVAITYTASIYSGTF